MLLPTSNNKSQLLHAHIKCGQNADTLRKTKIPNSYKLAIWDFLLVPGADVEWFCLGYGVLCDDILDSDGNY